MTHVRQVYFPDPDPKSIIMKKLLLVSAAVLATLLTSAVHAENVVVKDFAATMSPNGKMITYYSYRGDKSPDIFVAKTDGTHEKRLTINDDYADIEPTWSTDSQTIY
jgi:Tol biopolymer transport system component